MSPLLWLALILTALPGPGTVQTEPLDLGADRGVVLRGVTFQVAAGPALRNAAGGEVRLEDCRFVGGTVGAELSGATLLRCTFAGQSEVGLRTAPGAEPLTLDSCLFTNSGARLDAGTGHRVQGSWFVRSPLTVEGSTGNQLVGNSLLGEGLLVADGAQNTLAFNTVFDAPAAITLRDSRTNLLAGNWLLDTRFLAGAETDPAQNGLALTETSQGATAANVISSNLFQVSGPAVAVSATTEPTERRAAGQVPLLARNTIADNLWDRADSAPTADLVLAQMEGARDRQVATLTDWDPRGVIAQTSPGALGLTTRWLWFNLDGETLVLPNLSDPSFERTAPLNGAIWGAEPLPGATTAVADDGDARDGRHSLEVTTDTPTDDLVGWRAWSLPVRAGGTYGVALWVRTKQVTPTGPDGGATVRLRWLDGQGQTIDEAILLGPGKLPLLRRGSQPWTDLLWQGPAPEGAAWLEVVGGLQQATGTVRLDALSVDQIAPPPPNPRRTPWPRKVGEPEPPPPPAQMKPWHPPWGRVRSDTSNW
ncbi:MAG TPA: hypothetical protein DCZ72_06670 [Armatimonadetes bacterium]|nr:hypothetical protein [Armatimonadota bacterium]